VRDYYFGSATAWFDPDYQSANAIDWTLPSPERYLRGAAGYQYAFVNANRAYVDRTPTGIDWNALASDVRAGVLRPVFSSHGVTVYELPRARR
jgi:hypothetical protein